MSARLLLVYHSVDGQTTKVAERIAETLRSAGATVDVHDADDAPGPDGHHLVILGDSIHVGRHSRSLERYASRHRDELMAAPLALFQVSLTSSSDDEEHTAEAQRLVHAFLERTGIEPDLVGLFAGALAYTRYGWFKRTLMKRIAASDDGDIDTSVDHEYTDWDAVEAFALDTLEHAR
jgi:menaquinone-dependent protoporphyrinogen oxidase